MGVSQREQFRLIDAHIGANRLDEAAALLAPILSASPEHAVAHFRMAAIWQRRGNPKEALDAARLAARFAPDWPDAHRHLGRILFQAGQPEAALPALQRVIALTPAQASAHHQLGLAYRDLQKWHLSEWSLRCAAALEPTATMNHLHLCHVLVREGKFAAAADHIRHRVPSRAVLGTGRKDPYYTFDQMAQLAIRLGSTAGALTVARSLLERAADQAEPLLRDDDTIDTLKSVAAMTPRTPLDDGIDALVAGRPLAAFDAMAKTAMSGETVHAKYDTVIASGPHRGHPAWHAMSPFYHLWQDAENLADGKAVQNHWKSDSAVFDVQRSPEPLLPGISAIAAGHRSLIEALAPRLAQRPHRIIDIGCGLGEWLYLFARDFGVDIADLFGCDLHPGRIATARDLLRHLGRERGVDGDRLDHALQNNLFAADLLTVSAESLRQRCGQLDLAFLSRITMAFDDAQLDGIIAMLAKAGIATVAEVCPVERWQYAYGRVDLKPYFAHHGYVASAEGWLSERATSDSIRHLVLPRKYWVATRYYVFERK